MTRCWWQTWGRGRSRGDCRETGAGTGGKAGAAAEDKE